MGVLNHPIPEQAFERSPSSFSCTKWGTTTSASFLAACSLHPPSCKESKTLPSLEKTLAPSQATTECMVQTSSECPMLQHKLQPICTFTHEGEKVLSPLSELTICIAQTTSVLTSSITLTKVLRLCRHEKQEREMCVRERGREK